MISRVKTLNFYSLIGIRNLLICLKSTRDYNSMATNLISLLLQFSYFYFVSFHFIWLCCLILLFCFNGLFNVFVLSLYSTSVLTKCCYSLKLVVLTMRTLHTLKVNIIVTQLSHQLDSIESKLMQSEQCNKTRTWSWGRRHTAKSNWVRSIA